MPTKSINWKYRIEIKHLFEENVTLEVVTKLCNSLIPQLQKIAKSVASSNLVEDVKDYLDNELLGIIERFSFLKDLATGKIRSDEWEDFGFDGDFEETVNNYLEELYDIADSRVLNVNNILEKFLWIG